MKEGMRGPDRAFGRIRRGILCAVLMAAMNPVSAQTVYLEDFEGLTLGPNVEESVPGEAVWTKGPPAGWVADDSGVPGFGTSTNGVTEWAGWSFANKEWWILAAEDQNRSRFTRASGTVMIADPDEWDDLQHLGSGLSTDERTALGLWFDTYITTGAIDVSGIDPNTLVLVFDSSWRPEFDDNYHQSGIVEAIWGDSEPQQILLWLSDPNSEYYKPDDDPGLAGEGIYTSTNEKVVVPLNNPAGATELRLKFGMFDAGNDWWWAVDNIRVGVPPLVTGAAVSGTGFRIEVTEALGFTVDDSAGVTADMDGESITVAVERGEDEVELAYDQSPEIFAPRSRHTVEVTFETSDGRELTETVTFTAPGYVTAGATPSSVTATIGETDYLQVDEGEGITLEIDGQEVSPVSVEREDVVGGDGTDLPDRIHVRYSAATPFPSGSTHEVAVTFTTASGQELVETVSFTVPAYTTIPAQLGTALNTGSDRGMRWRTHQIATSRGTTIAEAEQQLRGELGESIHDPTYESAPGNFDITFVNFDEFGNPAGNFNSSTLDPKLFVYDELIPGIPGLEGGYDYIAGEALAYVALPEAGVYTMGVNSDDGFQVSVGTTNNTTFLVLGGYDAGRGAADTLFHFAVEEPGLYLFRLLWFEGSGGASVEWFTVWPNGDRALLNGPSDTAVPALETYRRRTVAEPDLPSQGGVSDITVESGMVVITYTGTLKSAASVEGPYTEVAGAASPYTVEPSESQRFYIAE